MTVSNMAAASSFGPPAASRDAFRLLLSRPPCILSVCLACCRLQSRLLLPIAIVLAGRCLLLSPSPRSSHAFSLCDLRQAAGVEAPAGGGPRCASPPGQCGGRWIAFAGAAGLAVPHDLVLGALKVGPSVAYVLAESAKEFPHSRLFPASTIGELRHRGSIQSGPTVRAHDHAWLQREG